MNNPATRHWHWRDPEYVPPVTEDDDDDAYEPADYTEAELDEAAANAENKWG